MARLEIGWENKGEKAVGSTIMEVLVPGSIPEFGWTDKWRGAIRFWNGSDFAAAPATRRGGETPAQCVSTEMPRLRLRTLTLRWVSFRIEPGMIEIPVRAKAESDDLPDGVDEVTLDDVRAFVPRGEIWVRR